jgi:adenylate kinase family enzyme
VVEKSYLLDDDTHNRIYNERLALNLLAEKDPQEQPQAVFLVGQPGAGKSRIAPYLVADLNGTQATLHIDGDRLRAYHPEHGRLLRERASEAAALLNPDAAKWVHRLAADAAQKRVNVVLDTTMRDAEGTKQLAKMFRKSGYRVEAVVVATPERVSLLTVFQRHEATRQRQGAARYVPPAVHEQAYQALPHSLAAAEKQQLFDQVRVITRQRETVYDSAQQRIPAAAEQLTGTREQLWSRAQHTAYQARWDRLIQDMMRNRATQAVLNDALQTRRQLVTRDLHRGQPANVLNPYLAGKLKHAQRSPSKEPTSQAQTQPPDGRTRQR